MAWRIVKQPNGLYARFSTIVDHFTHYNYSEQEAVELCCELCMGQQEALEKVAAGVSDFEPRTRTPGDGLSRWRDCLETIEIVHGKAERDKVEQELTELLLLT